MKLIHKPVAKRNDPVKDWRQRSFRALYKDLPASAIPNNAVSEARNVCLFGEHWCARLGDDQLASLTFPQHTAFTTASKSGSEVSLSSAETWPDDIVGSFIVWPDGLIDQIQTRNTAYKVTTVGSTVTSETSCYIQGRINAGIWFEKTQEIFMLLGNKLYYTDTAFSSWTEIIFIKSQTPSNKKSTFKEYEDSLYLFNENGHYRIDTTYSSYRVFQINTAVSANTIVPSTDETRYPPTAAESTINRFGRRYLFTLSIIDGLYTGNRGDGTSRLVKETGSNTAPESNDYIDYKESWRPHFWGNDGGQEYHMNIIVCDLDGSNSLPLWLSSEKYAFALTMFDGVDNHTRDVSFNISQQDINNWNEIAAYLQKESRAVFPEYEYIQVIYDPTTPGLIFISGEADIDAATISARSDPNVGDDFIADGYIVTGQINVYTDLNGWGTIGTDATAALEVPSGQYGFTHFSLYSTRTIGSDFEDENGNSLVNENYFTWQNDVPIIKTFKGEIVGNITNSIVTLSQGTIESLDLGSRIYFRTNLTFNAGSQNYSTVIEITSSTVFKISNVIVSTTTIECAIGASTILVGTRSGDTVTLSQGTVASTDVGKVCFWDDGNTNIITAFTDSTHFTVSGTGGDATARAVAIEPIGRNYNDDIKDDLLEAREGSYPLRVRLYSALPSGSLGALVPGFMVTSEVDSKKFYYSDLNIEFQYYAGHHNALYQYDVVRDIIKEIEEMPNQLIIWCHHSTWREQVNVVDSLTDDRTGDSLSILSGLGEIDKYIGVADKSCITDFITGQKIVITSEPGIRTFDGYKYSHNMLYDQEGNSYINTEFEQFEDEILAYYEPNFYGLLFFATNADTAKLNGSFVKSTIAWRLAMERQQGFSFAEFDGDEYKFPEFGGGIMRITSANGNKITIVFGTTGKPHYLCTRSLPTQESLDLIFTDDNISGTATEIDWTIGLKEHTNQKEHFLSEYLEEWWYFRPHLESLKDASGYDEYGFRDAQELTSKIYIDGDATDLSSIITENPLATIYQPYNIRARRIKLEMNGTASSIKGVGNQLNYKVLDRRVSPENEINETTQKKVLSSNMSLWFTRGKDVDMNRVTGSQPDTTNDFTAMKGPDAKTDVTTDSGQTKSTNSAFYIDDENPIEYDSINLPLLRMIVFSFYVDIGTDGTVVIYTENDDATAGICVKVVFASSVATLQVYNDNALKYSKVLTDNKWYMIAIYSSNTYLFDVDGLVETGTGMGTTTALGSVTVTVKSKVSGSTSYVALHDFRIYAPSAASDQPVLATLTYLNKDVYKRNGFSLLPSHVYTYS